MGRAGLRWSPAVRETVERRWTAPAAWRKRRKDREGKIPAPCNTHVNPHTHKHGGLGGFRQERETFASGLWTLKVDLSKKKIKPKKEKKQKTLDFYLSSECIMWMNGSHPM